MDKEQFQTVVYQVLLSWPRHEAEDLDFLGLPSIVQKTQEKLGDKELRLGLRTERKRADAVREALDALVASGKAKTLCIGGGTFWASS